MAKAVIWDMDGVLVDTGPFHFRAWQRILRERGRTLKAGEFVDSFGMKNEAIIRRALGELPPEEVDPIGRRKEVYFRQEIAGRVQPFPGVEALLESLGPAGFRQALASSAPRENIGLVLEELGIRRHFQVIVSGDDIKAGKPDPEIFLAAARRLGVPPARCVVLEDSVAGVKAAKAAGMRCVAVTNTSPPERLAEADLVVESLEELSPQALDRLLG